MGTEVKFKKGDRVMCRIPYGGLLTPGKEYTVLGVHSTGNSVQVLDDQGEPGHYYASRFELAAPVVQAVSSNGYPQVVATLPASSSARKSTPMCRGVLDYFPAALAEVARLSKAGNDKHNPGEEMHHARSKSSDHADCIIRHLMDRGAVDPEDGIRHSVKVAWRALALLQEELEAAGLAPLARGAKL